MSRPPNTLHCIADVRQQLSASSPVQLVQAPELRNQT